MAEPSRISSLHRLDELRRLATSLASSLGVAPARSSALATHLLWFDAAGASSHGIATLPTWLDRIDRKEIDPVAKGCVRQERAGTAIFDAESGLPPLILETAAGISQEKAREVGVGIVRVRNLGPSGPPAPVVAGLAIGPFVAIIAGPGRTLATGVPMSDGLPLVFDSNFSDPSDALPVTSVVEWIPWITTIADGDEWVILTVSITAFGTLSEFHNRLAASSSPSANGRPGRLEPKIWEARRRETMEHGVSLDQAGMAGLKSWADRLGVQWPIDFDG